MPKSASRNPSRTRKFYDSIMDSKDTVLADGQNQSMATSIAPTVRLSSAFNTSLPATSTAAPTPVAFSEDIKFTAEPSTTVKTTNITGASKDRQLMNVFNEMWDGVRGMFGMKKPSCMNGGKPNQNGFCDCAQYFNGTSCEKKLCINGGVLKKVESGPISYECQCPNSLYIDGQHCERIKCANGASLHLEQNGSWYCDCSHKNFYKGVFCEKFSPPMGFVIPVLIVLVFLLCCGLCRINWCPRKRSERRQEQQRSSRPRRRPPSQNTNRTRVAQPNRSTNAAQEYLLSGDRALCTRNTVPFPTHGNPYIIRLDTIPTFNPNMIGGVDPASVGSSGMKPMEPPPSYDQAVQAPPMPNPPRYSETIEQSALQTSQQSLPHSNDPPRPPM